MHDRVIDAHRPCISLAIPGPTMNFEAKFMLNTSWNVSPGWQSWGKVKSLFMTFRMAWGRQVGLCIKFIWNLHFDWPTVWANSTVTYRSDRDIWQLRTIAEMAFKSQPVRAGDIFAESHLLPLPSASHLPSSLGVAFSKASKPMETYFQRCKMKFWSLSPLFSFPFPSLPLPPDLLPPPPPRFHPWSHWQALFLLVKPTVVSGSACSRQMETVSMSLNDQAGIFLKCSLISVTPALDTEPGITLVSLLLSET